MTHFIKHRDEVLDLAIDFSLRLNSGESLTSPVVLRVHEAISGLDISSHFGSPEGTVVGETVTFTLGAAGASQQIVRWNRLFCSVTVSSGEILIETPILEVIDKVSTT